ncbi:MAG: PAS domain S-box protein [Candidatus Acidiferrum sp.]
MPLSGSGSTTSGAKSVRIPRTEEFYCRIYQQVATGVAITNWQGVFQECNPAFCALIGYTEEELRTIDFVSLIHPEDRQADLLQVRRLQVGEIPSFEIENRYIHKNGEPVWGRKFVSVLHGEDGEPTHLIALVTNVTEGKRAQERLLEYERVVELLGDRIIVVDREYRYVMANAAFLNYRGFEKDQVIGHTVAEIVGKETFEANIKEQFDECFRGKVVQREVKYSYPKLGARNILASYFPIRGPLGVDRIACVLRDITERKAAEEALRESEERFRLVANNAPVMIWMSGLDTKPTYFNQLWLDFTGLSETDLLSGLAGIVHPDDYLQCHDVYCRGFDQQQPFRKECRLRRHDGQYRWMLDVGVPRFLKDGSFAGYIGTCIDITDRKLAADALTNMSRKLVEAQEQERARIARELHDDINQRLAMLGIALQQFREHHAELPVEIASRMEELQEQTMGIANDVQALSHELHSSKLEYLGAVGGMKSWCKEFGERQGLQIEFKSPESPMSLPPEVGLPLFRVLQEALHNAAKHSGVRRIVVQLREDSGEIHLIVSDLGKGFDVEAAKQGRGLGLASMQERLRLVGGELSIESHPQHGTTIHARVPLVYHSMSAAG